MKEPVFTGVCTALVTPFTPDGSINYPKVTQLIEDQINAGVDALCVCGTTGEAPALSVDEQGALISHAVEVAAGRVKVLAGCGSNNVDRTLSLAQAAVDAGVEGLLVVTPYYNKTTQKGLVTYYTHLARQIPIPIILYNVPSRTGISFTAETYRELAKIPHINGVKEASGSLALALHTLALCGDDLNVWSGNDDQIVPLMALGAKGVVSVSSNILPGTVSYLTHQCLKGNFDRAAQTQKALVPLMDALFTQVNPIPVKAAMNMMGLDVGAPRLPLVPLEEPHRVRLEAVLDQLNLLPLPC